MVETTTKADERNNKNLTNLTTSIINYLINFQEDFLKSFSVYTECRIVNPWLYTMGYPISVLLLLLLSMQTRPTLF